MSYLIVQEGPGPETYVDSLVQLCLQTVILNALL